jgi:hypothetical protein
VGRGAHGLEAKLKNQSQRGALAISSSAVQLKDRSPRSLGIKRASKQFELVTSEFDWWGAERMG